MGEHMINTCEKILSDILFLFFMHLFIPKSHLFTYVSHIYFTNIYYQPRWRMGWKADPAVTVSGISNVKVCYYVTQSGHMYVLTVSFNVLTVYVNQISSHICKSHEKIFIVNRWLISNHKTITHVLSLSKLEVATFIMKRNRSCQFTYIID